LALAQAVTYLACAAKSNAVYRAFSAAQHDVVGHGSLEVPKHLRNAPTRLSKQLGHGEGYRYAHNEPDGYARGETYMPAPLSGKRYYFPSERGLELRIKEKLDRLRRSDDSGGKE
jgi:putative ATPase